MTSSFSAWSYVLWTVFTQGTELFAYNILQLYVIPVWGVDPCPKHAASVTDNPAPGSDIACIPLLWTIREEQEVTEDLCYR